MRKTFLSIAFLFAFQFCNAQYPWNDTSRRSLKEALAIVKDNSTKYNLLTQIFNVYAVRLPDSSLGYAQQALKVAMEIKSDVLISGAYGELGYVSFTFGDYAHALAYNQEALKYAKSSGYFLSKSLVYVNLAGLYLDEGDFEHAIFYAKDAKSLMESHWKPSFKMQHPANDLIHDTLFHYFLVIETLGEVYERVKPDSADTYYKLLNDGYLQSSGGKMDWPVIPYHLGNLSSEKKNYPEAFRYYRKGVAAAATSGLNLDLLKNYCGMANAFKNNRNFDSSIFYATKVLELSKYAHNPFFKLNALDILADDYKSQNNTDSLAWYLQLTIAAKDSLFSQQKIMQLQSMTFNAQIQDQELQQQKLTNKNRQNVIILLSGLAILVIVAGGLWRRNVYKQRSYAMLQKQKQEIDFQKTKVEKTLEELKSTQAQLVQSEKMASLGELTAGIAHEIQNPLNFVNNFSEVNRELVDELKSELTTGNRQQAIEIADDIKDNSEKINYHGKRADAIVKGMLQHSRASSGQKELTDINPLADEYLRLAYHGFRAKDKSFNAKFETDLDKSIGKIKVVPQDIGRVLLNLINNAFYAVDEKKRQLDGSLPTGEAGYEPCVSVTTRKVGSYVEVRVKDNGNGIQQKVLDKIFQPFFTTKPTGVGTGLGLSLSYDIIKAHGGELKVETKEGEGAEFIIQLPNA